MVIDESIMQILGPATVLLGALLYNYVGWLKFGKATGEKYDVIKLLKTVIIGGGMPMIASSMVVPTGGVQLFDILTCFCTGLAFSAGIDQLQRVTEKDAKTDKQATLPAVPAPKPPMQSGVVVAPMTTLTPDKQDPVIQGYNGGGL